MLIAARTIEEDEDRETPNEYKMKKKNERKTQWTQKHLHGQFFRQTMGKTSEDRRGWLRKGCLKRKSFPHLNNGRTGTGYKNQQHKRKD